MILHVVGSKEFHAVPERELEEESFFISNILDMAASLVCRFKSVSTTSNQIEAIANRAVTFEYGAQKLALSFNSQRMFTSADGVLCMFELAVDDPHIKIYSLGKYDYNLALEQRLW